MGSALVAGGALGASNTPEGENKAMHGLLWGSVAATVIGSGVLLLSEDSKEVRDRDFKIKELEQKMSQFKENSKVFNNQGESHFLESSLPKEYRSLVKPGKWKVFKIDEWKKTSSGEYVHQDKLLEIEPPEVSIE